MEPMTDLQTWMAHPERLNADTLDTLRGLVERHPYFQPARFLYLKNLSLLRDPSFADELCRSVIYIVNRAELHRFLEADGDGQLPQAATDNEEHRTLAIIDAFLSSMPEESTYAAIGNGIATDYASYLLRQEPSQADADPEVPPMRGQTLIDRFIREAEDGFPFHHQTEQADAPQASGTTRNERPANDEPAEAEDDSYFTETLAKIYIKQQRYAKAIEIIKKLSLKYPKKSTYFADQIKHLEELIINAKSNN